jgi:hypothetical protein
MQSSIGAGTKQQSRDTETELRGIEASVGACVTVPLYTHTLGEERGQAVKHGSFCVADADTDMSEVSCASGQRSNLKSLK